MPNYNNQKQVHPDFYSISHSKELSNRLKTIKECNHPWLKYTSDPPIRIGSDNDVVVEFPYGMCLRCGGTLIEIDEDYKLVNSKEQIYGRTT